MSAPRLNQHAALDELAPRTPIDRVAARVLSRGEREIVKTAKGVPWEAPASHVLDVARPCPRCKAQPILAKHKGFITLGCLGCGNRYNVTGDSAVDVERVTWSWNHWARAAS